MISRKDLRELAKKRLKDAEVLLKNRRYQGAFYLGGYVIELLLKYNICKIFKFSNGFPESKSELNSYQSKVKIRFTSVTSLSDFKTHDLPKLLTISGKEYDIKTRTLNEWTSILIWNPEFRYLNSVLKRKDISKIISNIKSIYRILL
ncbi:MAG: hypothetical protein IT281_05915 [Ignavibacteria bacterium]|nr:hypothetical protein [Ignavibacteria bacterium]